MSKIDELNELNFSLQEKKEKIKKYNTNIFTLNLEMQDLMSEISELEQQIKDLEEEGKYGE